ncbi:MAG: ATP-binding protein [Deltaproteobacteria bacterium]|nr:ATP-binding protein [Deltaproteobacteria bacterium]
MGLSIAKKIISDHHGDITVRSEVNKGTTFRIRIPLNPKLSS